MWSFLTDMWGGKRSIFKWEATVWNAHLFLDGGHDRSPEAVRSAMAEEMAKPLLLALGKDEGLKAIRRIGQERERSPVRARVAGLEKRLAELGARRKAALEAEDVTEALAGVNVEEAKLRVALDALREQLASEPDERPALVREWNARVGERVRAALQAQRAELDRGVERALADLEKGLQPLLDRVAEAKARAQLPDEDLFRALVERAAALLPEDCRPAPTPSGRAVGESVGGDDGD